MNNYAVSFHFEHKLSVKLALRFQKFDIIDSVYSTLQTILLAIRHEDNGPKRYGVESFWVFQRYNLISEI